MSILLSVEEADFVYLKEKTESTAGNLSVQLDKLTTAGYIEKQTDASGAKARTVCRMTETGRTAMQNYVICAASTPFLPWRLHSAHRHATILTFLT